MDESKNDIILSRIGRVVALFIYALIYLCYEFYLNRYIWLGEELVIDLFTGATLTLTLAKGIYSMLHQWSKKNNVFERIEYEKAELKH